MHISTLLTRAAGYTVAVAAVATCAIGPVSAAPTPAPGPAPAPAPKPKPKPQPKPVVASCTSVNPMFVIGSADQLNWKVTATPVRPGVVAFAGTGTAGTRDLVLSQFSSDATLSWNNTTTGQYGSVPLRGRGPLPTLDRVEVNTGKGSVTYNVVVRSGAGLRWIGTQESTPCIGTVPA